MGADTICVGIFELLGDPDGLRLETGGSFLLHPVEFLFEPARLLPELGLRTLKLPLDLLLTLLKVFLGWAA